MTAIQISSVVISHKINIKENEINADRWLEIDLYWFSEDNLKNSTEVFWDRFTPLFKDVKGWKGVIINVGWLMDYVLEWRGNLNDSIPLPENMKSQIYTNYNLLKGTTEQRKEAWHKRFGTVQEEKVKYEKWTYGDLKKLVDFLRKNAGLHGIKDLKVGTFVLGFNRIYGGEYSSWVKKHPEVFHATGLGQKLTSFNVEAKLNEDNTSYGGFTYGISKGMPVYDFFAGQWGDLSKKINLDALVLRDSEIGIGIYRKSGPYGKHAPPDPEQVEKYSQATANYVKAIKLANPKSLVIGYSNAASAVADWRVNCFDLEKIAKEGYLDAFIEQTWAGAWNEVGQRKETFWNHPTLGWTPQLAYMLLHSAILNGTKVKHYTLAETFDAWEPWDIIHTAPERLRWGIWAYLHAGVKTPEGLEFPSGTYISWANQGKRLLSEDDVRFLAVNINEATLDASNTIHIFGPTLVYNRSAMEWQTKNKPAQNIKEWIDEQAGMVMKWSLPILSVTRMEYLPDIEGDLFVLQTPIYLKNKEKDYIIKMIRSGHPVAVWGSPAGGIDKDIGTLTGLISDDSLAENLIETGRRLSCDSWLIKGIPENFKLFHLYSNNKLCNNADIIYTVGNSPALTVKLNDIKAVQWDPCDFDENIKDNVKRNHPISETVGSIYPYVLVSRSMNKILEENKCIYAKNVKPKQPIMLSIWQLKDLSYRIMAADMEEGIEQSADTIREVTLVLPSYKNKSYSGNIIYLWHTDKTTELKKNNLDLILNKNSSILLQLN